MTKVLFTGLAALLLAAAATAPAAALEHQVSGRFASFFALSNYSDSGVLAKDAPSANWFDQRLRLTYQAKADENTKLVSKFELDYAFWGNSSYVSGRGQGGAVGADTVNLETKNLYLDWTAPALKLNTKLGMQGYDDGFSGILFSTDMAGILLTHNYTNASVALGFFRWEDMAGTGLGGGTGAGTGTVGRDTVDLYALTGSYSPSQNLKLGGAYYYIQDENDVVGDGEARVHTLGVNAESTLGKVNLKGFVLGQFGDFNGSSDAKGYAAKAAANLGLGQGTLRGDVLYVAGGENQLYVTRDGNGYYDNELMIVSRDKNATTIDNALVYDLNNRGEGVLMAALGFDQPFSATFSGSVNVGYAQVADNRGDGVATDPNDNSIGTEVNLELVKKATENVTVSGRAGYVFLGDHFLGNPDDPYAVQLLLSYAF